MCVFSFVLRGVCALSTSSPMGKCNRCAFQCSGSKRAEGSWKAGEKGALTSFGGCRVPACSLSAKSAGDHRLPLLRRHLREKKAKNAVANYLINITIEQGDHMCATLKIF